MVPDAIGPACIYLQKNSTAPSTGAPWVCRSSKNSSPKASASVSAVRRLVRVVIIRAAETMKSCEPPSV